MKSNRTNPTKYKILVFITISTVLYLSSHNLHYRWTFNTNSRRLILSLLAQVNSGSSAFSWIPSVNLIRTHIPLIPGMDNLSPEQRGKMEKWKGRKIYINNPWHTIYSKYGIISREISYDVMGELCWLSRETWCSSTSQVYIYQE